MYAQLANIPMVTISNLLLVFFKHIIHKELHWLIMLILFNKFSFSWIAYDKLKTGMNDTPWDDLDAGLGALGI